MVNALVLLNLASILFSLAGLIIFVEKTVKKEKSGFLWISFINLGNALRCASRYLKEEATLTLVVFGICLIAFIITMVMVVKERESF